MDAFTRGVAYVNGDENLLGVLECGRQGDVAVLSHDVFSIPAAEIGHTDVELTVAGGVIVHGDE
jgi:predicted amidohydrolase YtcJ